MIKKQKFWLIVAIVVFAVAVGLLIAAWIYSVVCDVPFVEVWQTCFGLIKKMSKTPVEDVVEGTRIVFFSL